jgi:predicted nucleotidyltransferase
MNANLRVDLPENELNIVMAILKQYVSHCQVLAFGSRVNGSAKKHSDLDLAIISTKPLNLDTLADLSDAFSESDLNIRVDIVDFLRVDKSFQDIIKKTSVLLKFEQ